MNRLLPAGLGAYGTRAMWVLGALGALKGLAIVVIAESVARGIVAVIDGSDAWRIAVASGIIAAIVRGAVSWATGAYAAHAAIGTKERLRHDLTDRAMAGGTGPVGSLATLATHGLDDLDHYFARVLPAVATTATVPLIVGTRILAADWVSALVIVLTVPLIPIFMALIGLETRDRVDAASAALARLSDHLVELARGLPVLVGLGRVDEQSAALDRISRDYRTRTMATLRTAFLSSLALELIATISVAVVAVFIGFRLVDGSMPLEIGLLVLVLAPECYAPFRDVGTAFHAASDGVAAVDRATAVIESTAPVPVPVPGMAGVAGASGVSVRGLTVTRDDRGRVVGPLDVDLPVTGITALAGASGRGKTTVLRVLAGRLGRGDGVRVAGSVCGIGAGDVAWASQHPSTVSPTVADEVRLYGASDAAAVLHRFELGHLAGSDPAQLSPGELRRLAIARVVARVEGGARVVLLDEPTAHLDDRSAALVEREIRMLGAVATVLVASHEGSVIALADHVVWLGDAAAGRAAGHRTGGLDGRRLEAGVRADDTVAPGTDRALARGHLDHDATIHPGIATAPAVSPIRILTTLFAPTLPRLLGAVALGTLAALFAVALTAVSGWLIVRASQQPAIMYLMVAIVGVRFFGIGRSVIRYAERLLTHDTVFRSVASLRARLWRGFATLGPSSRVLSQGGRALDYLVTAADAIRDLVPRVLLPPLVGLATAASAVVAFAMIAPATVPVLLGCLAVSLIGGPALALLADRRASRLGLAVRSQSIRGITRLIGAADDLRANGVDGAARAALDDLDRRAGDYARRGAFALGLGQGLVVATGGVGAMLVLAASVAPVGSGAIAPELVAVLVLVPLALVDPLLSVVDAVQQWPTLRGALRRVGELEGQVPVPPRLMVAAPATRARSLGPVVSLDLDHVSVRWPGAEAPAVMDATAHVTRGQWLVVSGPSGSGKSTLLSMLLGHLPVDAGRYRLGGVETGGVDAGDLGAEELRQHVAWCPQESHLFDSTLRGNLMLGRPRDDATAEADLVGVLHRVGLGALLTRLPLGLDTPVGPSGAFLSGGERQRVAVARTLLTRADVVLLDEPTAHLDAEAAEAMLADLRSALADRIVVLVTHHLDEVDDADVHLDLGVRPRQLVND
ncbi:thiol reductant ABC exporter subunit CydD [Marisediminicola senii]|uniref:thiol reductant ABC exporter subunit CydD n=1 Tax=Marisediminicola senii TaxID=2711233 RepID=UPI0013EBF64C|nr:thiol reductant ABC exporter subunit CydD [Marisediminicola senii]